MTTFHFDPSRIRDPILRTEAIYLYYERRHQWAAPSSLRIVESEGSDDVAEAV